MPSRLSTRDWSISPESCEYDTDCRAVLLLNSWLFRQYHVHRAQPRRINLTHHSPTSLHCSTNAAKSWTRKWRMHRRRHPKAGRRYSRCRVRCSRRRPRQPGRSLSSTRSRARRLRREPTKGIVHVYAKDFHCIACQVRNMGTAKTGLPMYFFWCFLIKRRQYFKIDCRYVLVFAFITSKRIAEYFSYTRIHTFQHCGGIRVESICDVCVGRSKG